MTYYCHQVWNRHHYWVDQSEYRFYPGFFYCDTLKNIALDFSIENDSKQKKVDYQLPDYLCLIPISDPISNLHNYMARAVFTSSFGPATLTELNQLSWYVQQIWIIHATIFEKMSCKRLEAIQTSVFFFYFNSKIKKKRLLSNSDITPHKNASIKYLN